MSAPVTQSRTGYISALSRTWTIRKPTHLIIDERGEIVAMAQTRGDVYSSVSVIQFGDEKPQSLFGYADCNIRALNNSGVFHHYGQHELADKCAAGLLTMVKL